jgi:hypothetical protein
LPKHRTSSGYGHIRRGNVGCFFLGGRRCSRSIGGIIGGCGNFLSRSVRLRRGDRRPPE